MKIERRNHGVTIAKNHGIEKRHARKSIASPIILKRSMEVMAEHFRP
jgi:hypothetical protein